MVRAADLLVRDCIDFLLSAGDFYHDLVGQADDTLIDPTDSAVIDADLVVTVRIRHLHRAVFYGNLIGMIVLADFYDLILRQTVGAVKFTIYSDNGFGAAASGEGPVGQGCAHNEKYRQKNDISFFYYFEHKHSEVLYMKKFLSMAVIVSMTLTLIITQTGCAGKAEPVSRTSYYMDTMCQIDIYDMEDMSEEKAASAIDDAFALCAEYEALLSATKEGSDIYRINHADGKPVECDPRTVEVIEKGLYYGKVSGGKFDITIGRAADLWDFHEADPQVPSKEAVKEAMKGVGYENVSIEGNTVTLGNADMELTLGGIGKGYVGDRAAEKLEAEGVTSAVVNFGGNIIVIGDKEGEDFKIGVEKPFTETGEIVGYVTVQDATVVTSGIYERGFEKDGRYYHHILDVETGWPCDTDVASVSLIGAKNTSADCDAMSTICLLLGVEDGVKFIESVEGVEAVFVDRDGNLTKTSGLTSFVEE